MTKEIIMKAIFSIMAVMFLITSCGGSKSGAGGTSESTGVGSDDALKVCAVKFKSNDNEHEAAIKGHLVRSLCKIKTEDELVRKIAFDLKN